MLALRRLCLEAGQDETLKWGHPRYAHAGRTIALIGAMRADFRLSVFNAALMTDAQEVLERSGPNAWYPDVIRFRRVDAGVARAAALRGYLAEAMGMPMRAFGQQRTPVTLCVPTRCQRKTCLRHSMR